MQQGAAAVWGEQVSQVGVCVGHGRVPRAGGCGGLVVRTILSSSRGSVHSRLPSGGACTSKAKESLLLPRPPGRRRAPPCDDEQTIRRPRAGLGARRAAWRHCFITCGDGDACARLEIEPKALGAPAIGRDALRKLAGRQWPSPLHLPRRLQTHAVFRACIC